MKQYFMILMAVRWNVKSRSNSFILCSILPIKNKEKNVAQLEELQHAQFIDLFVACQVIGFYGYGLLTECLLVPCPDVWWR